MQTPLSFGHLDTFLGFLYLFYLFCAMMTTTAHSILGTDILWFVQGQDNMFCVPKAFIRTASILLLFCSCIQDKSRDSETLFLYCNRQLQSSSSDNSSLDYFPITALHYFCLHGSYFPHFSTYNFVLSYLQSLLQSHLQTGKISLVFFLDNF